MWRWFVRRLFSLVAVLLLVTAGTYALIELLPGDPAITMLGLGATPARVEALRQQLHLDRAWPVRYGYWLSDVVQGDFGRSRRYPGTVVETLRARLPRTLQLLAFAEFFSLMLAVPLGVWAGWRAHTKADRAVSTVAFAAMALPPFMIGQLLVYAVAIKFHLFPTFGYKPLLGDPLGALHSTTLPALTLALPLAGIQLRALRASVVETMQRDHVLLARANGLSTWQVLSRHVLRQSSLTMLTIIVVTLPWVLSFIVVVERMFNNFGAGELLSESVTARDFVTIQGTVLAFALLYLVVSLTIEAMQAVLDPRVRRGRPT